MPQATLAALPVHFASLPDPRVVGRTAYPLENILFIAVTAVICGVDTYTGMAVFAKAKRAWLAQYLDLASGLPSHDTFNDVLSQLNPEEFERCLLSWITALVAVSKGQFLMAGGEIQSRLRECSFGEVHDCPSLLPAALGVALGPGDIVAALEVLEQQGVVIRAERVHPYDSAEYAVTWRKAGSQEKPPLCQYLPQKPCEAVRGKKQGGQNMNWHWKTGRRFWPD